MPTARSRKCAPRIDWRRVWRAFDEWAEGALYTRARRDLLLNMAYAVALDAEQFVERLRGGR